MLTDIDTELTSGDDPTSTRRSPSDVLVVDDESAVRRFLARCLTQAGYTVRHAASAVEALDMMIASPASLVLCDIRMPEHDGLWLAARLHDRWPHIPFVMASAIDDLDTIRQSRELGAVDYVTKPIAAEELLEVVRRAMTSTASVRPTVEAPSPEPEFPATNEGKVDAEYTLESPVRCPACGERMTTVKAIRLVRGQVNFVSTLPRRGRVIACPHCVAVIPAELTNF